MSFATITPKQLHDRIVAGESIELIDVRTPVEFREVHVQCARNVPLDRLDGPHVVAGHSTEHPLFVICRSGSRGKQACEKLLAAGHGRIVNVEGGTLAWEQAGFPVIRGKKAMSLERQVRIAAGAIVLAGALLSFVHPYWAFLAAFVGAGLIFAGITDTCAMGMLIARMPWNQVSTPKTGNGSASNLEQAAPPNSGSCCGS